MINTNILNWNTEDERTIDNMTLEALTLCLERQDAGRLENEYCNEYYLNVEGE